ncbi:MAG: response regulator transcription factor [Desulfovermiculus sp.]|nr:response regulator transcription factor [Desulfovermiculus sp.]
MNMQGSRILVVEDEKSLALGLEFNLQQEGFEVVRAADGRQAMDCVHEHTFDLIILDIMLPFMDGFEVARRIREQSPQMPILMLTAKTSVTDRIQGLETGADDYLTKPFHLTELMLRIQGMLKRKQWYQDQDFVQHVFQFGPNKVNFQTLVASAHKQEVRLTSREAMVLKYLIEHEDKVVSRKELLENVWYIHSDVETRTVDAFIARLRKYFESDPKKPVFIKSVRGVGYIFSRGKAREGP